MRKKGRQKDSEGERYALKTLTRGGGCVCSNAQIRLP